MKKISVLAGLVLLTLSTGAFAQDSNVPPQSDQSVLVEARPVPVPSPSAVDQPAQPIVQSAVPAPGPAPVAECQVPAPVQKTVARKHHRKHSCKPARPIRAIAAPVVQKVEPVTNVQTIIEKTIIKRIIVNEPTVIIQSPPTIVRQPCHSPCARPATVCGPRPCPVSGYGQSSTVGPQGPTAAPGQPGGGYIAGAPQNAQECIARGGQLANEGRGCAGYR